MFSLYFAIFFIIANVFLGCEYAQWLCRHVPGKEGGIQVLVGLDPSNQTVRSLLRTDCPAKPAGKINQKAGSVNSLKRKNTMNYF